MRLKDIIQEAGPKGYDSDGNPLGGGYDEYHGEVNNNVSISINGKVWKVIPGEGEMPTRALARAKAMCATIERNAAAKGRKVKCSYGVTGADPTTEAAKPHPKELEMDAKVRSMQIQNRADTAEKRLAARKAEPKTIGQKIAKDIGGPLKKLAKGDIKGAFSEDATAGSTSAANVSVGAVYKNKSAKQAKNKDGTAKNALDMKGVGLLTGGSLVKR
jgi:hypothetical protein